MNATDASRLFASRTFAARVVSPGQASWPVRILGAIILLVVALVAIVVIVPLAILFIAFLLIRGVLRAIFGSGRASPRPANPRGRTATPTQPTPIDADFDVIDTRTPSDTDAGRQNVRVRQSM